MENIPLADNFHDVIGKAQRGLKLSDAALAKSAEMSVASLEKIKSGEFDEVLVGKISSPLHLAAKPLLALGRKNWYPPPHEVEGLACFNTTYEDMMVNSYLIFDPQTREAAIFDTGADASVLVKFAEKNNLQIKLILLTHTHVDHVADLENLKKATSAPAHVCELESFSEAEPFRAGKVFSLGHLKIETRQTSGHARGGITYVISGLKKPVAITGDAIFCCSMGGGMISFEEALRTNRKEIFTLADETILCPGHGPLTTVGEQKLHNPFFPEFKMRAA
ncbi:MAG: MBL fold metallo-hydrolase [Limisphaerales bacterium]